MSLTAVPPDVLNNSVGAILIATLLSSALFGVLSVQVGFPRVFSVFYGLSRRCQIRIYYCRWASDPLWTRFMVAIVLCVRWTNSHGTALFTLLPRSPLASLIPYTHFSLVLFPTIIQ